MKKFLALVVALVMVLAIAAPAMAFTSVTKSDDETSPFELDLYLVEYEDNDFFGITTLPASDRGYAKNEIVAAVAELFVPEDEDPAAADYGFTSLEFSGESISFNVTDNAAPLDNVNAAALLAADYTITADDVTIALTAGDLLDANDDVTYKFLVFAKIVDDEASMTFALRTDAAEFDADTLNLDLGDDYAVVALEEVDDDWTFTVSNDGVNLFTIVTNDEFESKGLQVFADGEDVDAIVEAYTVVALSNGALGFISAGTLVDDDSDLYEDLMEVYEEEFVAEFGFDFALIGGVVDFDTFLDYVGSDDIEVSVDIAPWTAYVTVPDNIVVDPPKTGDAASILGFVMIVLAAAAMVATRKVRA